MIRRRFAITVLLLAMLCALVWLAGSRTAPRQSRTACFLGFTNGVVGAIVPGYSALTPNTAQQIKRWFAAGTNGALFSITNRENRSISFMCIAHFSHKDSEGMYEQVPLLNDPNLPGIFVKPGQVVTAQVAVLPHQGPWKVSFHYSQRQESVLDGLIALPRNIGARITGAPIRVRGGSFESDWITP